MGFGGKVDDAGGLVLGKEGVHGGTIADVGVGKAVARGVSYRGERLEVAGVGEFVDVDDGPVAFGDQQPN